MGMIFKIFQPSVLKRGKILNVLTNITIPQIQLYIVDTDA